MRYHDIERLKQAASRVNGFAGTLADFEELTDYAIDKLDEPSGVRKVDNGDNTETWYGLPVVVPVGLVPDDETPVEVRSLCLPITSRFIAESGRVEDPVNCRTDEDPAELCIILGRKPQPVTWTPPASLPDGEYSFVATETVFFGNGNHYRRSSYKDWTDPPRLGRYKVENGTAVWLGE